MSLERQFVAFEIFSDMPFENVREYIDSISNARGEEEKASDSDGTERQVPPNRSFIYNSSRYSLCNLGLGQRLGLGVRVRVRVRVWG